MNISIIRMFNATILMTGMLAIGGLPSQLNAQPVPADGFPGDLQNCTDAYSDLLKIWLANRTGAMSAVTCTIEKGSVHVATEDEVADEFVAAAFNRDPNVDAVDVGDKACAVFTSDEGASTFNLSGKDFSQWKKFVKNQCSAGLAFDDILKFVFETEQQWFAHELAGIDGADAKCNVAAIAAGLPGTYTAWLSDSNIHAIDRVTNSTLPYFLPDGAGGTAEKVADDFADILDCGAGNASCLDFSIRRDENGVQRINREAWTGTWIDGMRTGTFCGDWTTNNADTPVTGSVNFVTQAWTNQGNPRPCTQVNVGLYCFQD